MSLGSDVWREFLETTPVGIRKCLAAWDGLAIESQIQLLREMEKRGTYSRSIPRRALESQNAYVRYLAARLLSSDVREDDTLKTRIEADTNPLVRFSLLERSFVIRDETLEEPAKFFTLPQESRLAKLRALSGYGENVAKILTHGANLCKDGKLTEWEICELAHEYVANPSFRRQYFRDGLGGDGFGEYMRGNDVKSLWLAIPNLPEAAAYILLQNLPEESGLSRGIPNSALKQLTSKQLISLFDRADISMRAERKKVFLNDLGEKSDVRAAAASQNMDLLHDEFAEVIRNEPAKKFQDLEYLASAKGLPLCMLEASADSLREMKEFDQSFYRIQSVESTFQQRLKKIIGNRAYGAELVNLRLYRLAKREVERARLDGDELNRMILNSEWSDYIKLFQRHIVKEDVWATFIAFHRLWGGDSRIRNDDLNKHIPEIPEVEEAEDAVSKNFRQLESVMSSRLSRMEQDIAALKSEIPQQQRNIVRKIEEIETNAAAKAKSILDQLDDKTNFLARLSEQRSKEAAGATHLFIFVVIALLVWLLWKTKN